MSTTFISSTCFFVTATVSSPYTIADFTTLGTFVSSIFTIFLSFPLFTHRYLVFYLLTFIPLLFNAYHQHSSLRFISSLVFSQITMSSANSIVLGGSLLILSVSLSIITANRNVLNTDPWCSLTMTLKLSVLPTAHLSTVSLPSYISCTSRTFPFSIFS